MRLRHFLPIALLGIGALLAPACSSDDGSEAASTESNERDSNERDPEGGTSGDTDSDTGTDPGEGTMPDPGDLPAGLEDIPGMPEDFGDCISQAAAFSSLYFEALSGEGGAENAQRKAEALKEQLPDELHGDIEVISEAIGQVAEDGLLSGSDAMESDEYEAAADNISAYFDKKCGSDG